MSELAMIYSKTLSEIDLRFEEKRKTVEADLDQSKQGVVDLFENCGFSPNAVRDFDKMLLDDDNNYPLPYALRIGNLLPKQNNIVQNMLIPAILPFTNANATAFMIDHEQNNEEAIQHIFHLIAFRFMLSLPIGLCKFHFVDSHSFGKKFNVMNRLSEKIMTNAIVNDEKRLVELITELEQAVINVNQNQLIKYHSLEEFNKEAGTLAVPYRFVFISNFPHGFSKELTERFYKLIHNQNATKAGIYIFYSIDNAIVGPYGFDISAYMNISTLIYSGEEGCYEIDNTIFDKPFNDTFNIQLNTQLPYNLDAVIDAINRKVNNLKPPVISLDSYIEGLIQNKTYWKESTRLGIKVPIGKKPVDETVFFELGGETTDYFAMIGGRPGYGKTVLLHDIICNASIIYSPLELNFYLIDCTNGTGFKPYDKLPHATFVSITNQREYTISALDHLKYEMYRRADLFKNSGEKLHSTIEKIEEYRKQTGEILPRLLVIIDEFQVLLEKKDKISRRAGSDLEKIIREGRKYGIHIVLCTQSYRDLDFNTDQITLRIAHIGDSRIYLFCNKQQQLHRLTKDHSVVQGLVDQGIISEAEAEHHPDKNRILKTLGIKENIQPEISIVPILPAKGDVFLICSDGLSGMVSDEILRHILEQKVSLQEKGENMLTFAKQEGGTDNITLQLIHISNSPYKRSEFESKNSINQNRIINNKKDTKRNIFLIAAIVLLAITSIFAFRFFNPQKKDVKSNSQAHVEAPKKKAWEEKTENMVTIEKQSNDNNQYFQKSKNGNIINGMIVYNNNSYFVGTFRFHSDDKSYSEETGILYNEDGSFNKKIN